MNISVLAFMKQLPYIGTLFLCTAANSMLVAEVKSAMTDSQTTVHQLKELFHTFVVERGWDRFKSPKDLSMDIVSEVAELMDIFLFVSDQKMAEKLTIERTAVEHEIADVAFALCNFCSVFDIDISKALVHKMVLNEKKYPLKSASGDICNVQKAVPELNDNNTTIGHLKQIVKTFLTERGWGRCTSPKELSMAIMSEAVELMDLFLYVEDMPKKLVEEREAIEHEVADIMLAVLYYCLAFDINLSMAIEQKMVLNAQKHPAVR